MKLNGPNYNVAAPVPLKFKGPTYAPPQPADAPASNPLNDFWNLIGGTAATALDTATFGLASKGADAVEQNFGLGSGHDIQDRLDSASVPAKIAGTALGFMGPGALVSKGIGKVVPWLAKSTLPAVFANSAATSGVLSTGDQAARTGSVDPAGVGIDSFFGGALGAGIHGLARVVSPKARVMAKGSDLSPTDKTVATGFASDAAARGIPLSAPEALQATVPTRAMDLIALHDSAMGSPKGSQAAAVFNAERAPKIEAAGQSVIDNLGPRKSPFELQQAATDAIGNVKSGFGTTANLVEETAGGKKVAPSNVTNITTKSPYIQDATRAVLKDRGKIADSEQTLGRAVATNDVEFLGLVKDQLETMATRAEKGGDIRKTNILRANSRDLGTLMDRFAPAAKTARDIRTQGRSAIAELESGPLGVMSNTPKSTTQSNALFDPTTDPEANAAHDAIAHLPGDAARGALANYVDNAVSTDPLGFGKKTLPTRYSGDLIDAADRAGGRPTGARNTLEAAAAVNTKTITPKARGSSFGFASPVINALFNYGKGDIEKMLRDPEIIKKLGTMGILDKVLQRVAGGTELTAARAHRGDSLTGLKINSSGITFDPSTY